MLSKGINKFLLIQETFSKKKFKNLPLNGSNPESIVLIKCRLILSERQNKVNEFLLKIIDYEGKLAEFIKKRQNNQAEHLADINQGLVLTHKLLIKNIEKQGGLQIWAENNQKFNQQQHEVVGQAKLQKNSTIKSLLIPGWRLKEKIVRKAKVTVN